MTVNDIPLVSFFKRLVDPTIILGTLYGLTVLYGEVCTGFDVGLMIIAFFVSSHIFDHIDLSRTWRSGRLGAYVRDVCLGWGMVVAVLVVIGYATGLGQRFSGLVLGAWFAMTPVALLASHLTVHVITSRLRQRGELRSVAIVGLNEASLALARRIAAHPNLFMAVQGFFDDRGAERLPAGAEHRLLGETSEIAAYVRQNNIQLVFISLPMSAQPRIRKLVDDLHGLPPFRRTLPSGAL